MLKFSNSLVSSKNNYKKITIGNFDGVHEGHQAILSQLTDDDLIITFINISNKPEIYPIEVKLLLLKEFCPNIMILDFEEIKNDPMMKFIKFLQEFHPEEIIVGPDFTFGYNREGNVDDLKKYFDVKVVDFIKKDGKKISSSTIRECLETGNLPEANELLTRPFSVTDIIVAGHGRGNKLGFPTINFTVPKKFSIKRGVYETRTIIDGQIYTSITNIGTRPTFDNGRESIETYVINFDGDVYGQVITVEFIRWIREEKAFDSAEELAKQIEKDIEGIKNNH